MRQFILKGEKGYMDIVIKFFPRGTMSVEDDEDIIVLSPSQVKQAKELLEEVDREGNAEGDLYNGR